MIKCLFFGRFETEKWIIELIDAIKKIIKEDKIDVVFDFFWKWEYEIEINKLQEKFPNKIFNHWWQSQKKINEYLEKASFSLMPSLFLETFWMSALESISLWVPVIWFKKWWLRQFVLDKHDISNYEWQNDAQKIYNSLNTILTEFSIEQHNKDCQSVLEISKKYSLDKFKSRLNDYWFYDKKILLVSDFHNRLWWIENFVYDLENILSEKNNVKFTGSKIWKTKILRYISFLLSWFNFYWSIKLYFTIKKFKPDIVRFHSILRYYWWMSVFIIPKNIEIYMMYHDFWYFHPFPNKLKKENDILKSMTLWNFISAAKSKNILINIFVCLKYTYLKLLIYFLKKRVKLHIVPSEYMKETIVKLYKVDNVDTLPIFFK